LFRAGINAAGERNQKPKKDACIVDESDCVVVFGVDLLSLSVAERLHAEGCDVRLVRVDTGLCGDDDDDDVDDDGADDDDGCDRGGASPRRRRNGRSGGFGVDPPSASTETVTLPSPTTTPPRKRSSSTWSASSPPSKCGSDADADADTGAAVDDDGVEAHLAAATHLFCSGKQLVVPHINTVAASTSKTTKFSTKTTTTTSTTKTAKTAASASKADVKVRARRASVAEVCEIALFRSDVSLSLPANARAVVVMTGNDEATLRLCQEMSHLWEARAAPPLLRPRNANGGGGGGGGGGARPPRVVAVLNDSSLAAHFISLSVLVVYAPASVAEFITQVTVTPSLHPIVMLGDAGLSVLDVASLVAPDTAQRCSLRMRPSPLAAAAAAANTQPYWATSEFPALCT
jgi:hypothetical protein